MRELIATQVPLVVGGGGSPLASSAAQRGLTATGQASLQEWIGGGSLHLGAGDSSWSVSGGYRLPGGSSIGGHVSGLGDSVTGVGVIWSVPF